MAIIAGFAISEILAGWGRSLLRSGGVHYSGLQFLASLTLLFMTVRYIWTLWNFRSIEWLFGSFVLVLVPILTIALAAHVISIPSPHAADADRAYFDRARPFFLLLAAVTISWTLYDLANISVLRNSFPQEMNTTVSVLRAAGTPAFLWLAYTRQRSHHWVVLGATFASLVYLSVRALPALS